MRQPQLKTEYELISLDEWGPVEVPASEVPHLYDCCAPPARAMESLTAEHEYSSPGVAEVAESAQ